MAADEKELTGHERRLANLTAPRFKPGQSGNPSGRPKNVLTKALRKKLNELESDAPGSRTRAEVLMDKLYSMAEGGNIDALKMCLDRMEGRPRQSISLDVDEHGTLERKLDNFMRESERDGDPVERAEAIAILAEEDSRFEDFD